MKGNQINTKINLMKIKFSEGTGREVGEIEHEFCKENINISNYIQFFMSLVTVTFENVD